MSKTFLIGLFLMFGITTYGQIKPISSSNNEINPIRNGIRADRLNAEYALPIWSGQSSFSVNASIKVDYGQTRNPKDNNELVDENGQIIKFNSMADALNYMYRYGYEFISAYPITENPGEHIYHYILRKKKKELN
ncbi:MAG TPA: hypothetical protein DCX89_01530 [Saprospirales bacterium]|nr:hypothetical protein [Saprospirales bacterium]